MRFTKSSVHLALAMTVASTALIGLSASGAQAATCGFYKTGSAGQGTRKLNFHNCHEIGQQVKWDIIASPDKTVCVQYNKTASYPTENPVIGGVGQARGGDVVGSC
jgi:hypothetical protein